MKEHREQKIFPTNNANLEKDSDAIPQLDGPAEVETTDNVKIDKERVQHKKRNIAKKCCPLCDYDAETESEFKTHVLNHHEEMQVLKTFGKDWIEENTRHFFYMDKNRRKLWKEFLNEQG